MNNNAKHHGHLEEEVTPRPVRPRRVSVSCMSSCTRHSTLETSYPSHYTGYWIDECHIIFYLELSTESRCEELQNFVNKFILLTLKLEGRFFIQ